MTNMIDNTVMTFNNANEGLKNIIIITYQLSWSSMIKFPDEKSL